MTSRTLIVCPACAGDGFQGDTILACGECGGGGVVDKFVEDYPGHMEVPAKVRFIASCALAAYAAFGLARRVLACQPGYAWTKFRDEWADVRFSWKGKKVSRGPAL